MAQDHDALLLSHGDRWRADPAAACRWRAWDDEVVVYHEPTASTVLLPADAAAVFLTLCEAGADGLDAFGLHEALGEPMDDPSRAGHLRDILDSLCTRGLAECRAS